MTHINPKYLAFLQEKRLQKPLKIPRYLSQTVLQDKKLMKALCVWVELKPLFYDGRFKDARKQRKTLARYLNMSLSAFNYKVQQLKNNQLVRWDQSGDLILCSWDEFFTALGHRKTDNNRYKYYRIKNDLQNSEYFFRFYAIKENFERQKAVIDKKIYEKYYKDNLQNELLNKVQSVQNRRDIAILDRQRIASELIDQIDRVPRLTIQKDSAFKKFKRKNDFNSLYVNGCRNYFVELSTFNYSGFINFDISVSCKKMAEIFGLSSSSSGYYWQRVMNGHFWKIEARSIFIKDMNTFRFHHEKKDGNLNHHYFEGRKRGIFRRLTNRITLIEPELF